MIEYQKSQDVRLWDVFFIGPYLIYIAWKGSVSPLDKIILGFLGGATIAYNWYNYSRNQQQFHGSLLH